ncbi:MAG: hypothetical protein R6T83_06515 [Salinibacter sp.]
MIRTQRGALVVGLGILGLVLWFWWLSDPGASDQGAVSASLPLAMLADPEGRPMDGCDDVVFVKHDVTVSGSSRTDRLTAALDTLFRIESDSVGGARHVLARTNSTLTFAGARVEDDTARVALRGHLTGLRGVCDNPRARIQIQWTARRVAGVDTVEIFRDGRPTSLQPTGRGTGRLRLPKPPNLQPSALFQAPGASYVGQRRHLICSGRTS